MGKLWLSRLQFSVMLKGTAAHQLSEPPGDQTEGPQAAGDTRKVQTFPLQCEITACFLTRIVIAGL